MKAFVLHGPGEYRVENDWPMPEVPDGWALVKVAYAGICGSDIPRFFTTGSYHHPMIIGHEFSGVVEKAAVGSDIAAGTPVAVLPIIPCGECEGCVGTKQPFHCSRYQFIGSRNDGGFAQYVAVPDKNLFVLGGREELKTGAMIEPLAVGLHVARRSGIKGGTAVVFGAGPIGMTCAMWLDFLGTKTTIVDVRDYSINIARKMGLNAVKFDELGDNANFDCSFEASGSSAALIRAIDVTRDLGSVTVVGRNAKDTVLTNKLFERFMRKELTLNGCWGYNMQGETDVMREFVRAHDTSGMISHLISVDEVSDVLENVVRARGDYCKIMIDMGE